jgi:Pro-Pro endopeptidase
LRAAVKATPARGAKSTAARPRKAAPANRGYGQAGKAKHDPAKHPRDANGRFITTGGAGKTKTPRTKKAAAPKPPKPPKKVGTPKQRKGLADQIRAARAAAKTPEARTTLLGAVRDLRAKRSEWKRGQGKTQVERLPKPPKEAKPKKEVKPKKEAKPKTPKPVKEPKPEVEKKAKEPKLRAEPGPKAEKKPEAPKGSKPEAARPTGTPGSHETIEAARAWGEANGVKVVEGSSVTLDQLNAINRDVARMPGAALDAIRAAGKRLDVISGRGITDHPQWSSYRGVTPRGYPEGHTWDDVPGAGSGSRPATVIVANRLQEGHASVSLVMHEHAHTYDHALHALRGVKGSDSPEWREVHEKVRWPSAYERNYREEGYAESFARYHAGPTSRSFLPKEVHDYWRGQFPT